MLEGYDYEDVDGAISYAVIPESWVGTLEDINQPDEMAYAFWYSDYISMIANSPNGEFTETERQEVIEILSSFRTGDSIDTSELEQITLADYLDTDEQVSFYYLNFDNIFDCSQISEATSVDTLSRIFVFENGKCSQFLAMQKFFDSNRTTIETLFSLSNQDIYEHTEQWNNYILIGYMDSSGKNIEHEDCGLMAKIVVPDMIIFIHLSPLKLETIIMPDSAKLTKEEHRRL